MALKCGRLIKGLGTSGCPCSGRWPLEWAKDRISDCHGDADFVMRSDVAVKTDGDQNWLKKAQTASGAGLHGMWPPENLHQVTG